MRAVIFIIGIQRRDKAWRSRERRAEFDRVPSVCDSVGSHPGLVAVPGPGTVGCFDRHPADRLAAVTGVGRLLFLQCRLEAASRYVLLPRAGEAGVILALHLAENSRRVYKSGAESDHLPLIADQLSLPMPLS